MYTASLVDGDGFLTLCAKIFANCLVVPGQLPSNTAFSEKQRAFLKFLSYYLKTVDKAVCQRN